MIEIYEYIKYLHVAKKGVFRKKVIAAQIKFAHIINER